MVDGLSYAGMVNSVKPNTNYNSQSNKLILKLLPNPATNNTKIEYKLNISTLAIIDIINLKGKVIMSFNFLNQVKGFFYLK